LNNTVSMQTVQIFKALSIELRVEILYLLCEKEVSVNEIVKLLHLFGSKYNNLLFCR